MAHSLLRPAGLLRKRAVLGFALVLAFGFMAMGCASGPPADPGNLTITGIPAEFNGKFAAFSEDTKVTVGKKGIPIANGEVALPLYTSGFIGYSAYTGSDTYAIELCLMDTPEITAEEKIPPSKQYPQGATRMLDFRTHYATFEAVTFENGAATVAWEDLFKNAGSLTITGIPSEYQGKFVSSELQVTKPGPLGSTRLSLLSVTATKGVITSAGEFKLPLREESGVFSKTVDAYTGSDPGNVTLNMFDTASQEASAGKKGFASAAVRFDQVAFNNGEATVTWDNAIIADSVTITGIPAQYDHQDATVYAGYSVSAAGALVGGALSSLTGGKAGGDGSSSEARATDEVSEGTLIVQCFAKDNQSYTVTGAKDIMVFIDSGERKEVKALLGGTQQEVIYDKFLFKGVQITDGKAVLNFAQGVKQ